MAENKLSKLELEHKRKKLAKKAYLQDLSGKLTPEKKKKIQDMQSKISEAMSKEVDGDMRVKGVTEKIDTKSKLPLLKGKEHTSKVNRLRALKRLGTKGLKALPVVGAIGSALASRDVSAAVPILGEADPIGPLRGSLEASVEDPSQSLEDRIKAIKALKKRNR